MHKKKGNQTFYVSQNYQSTKNYFSKKLVKLCYFNPTKLYYYSYYYY